MRVDYSILWNSIVAAIVKTMIKHQILGAQFSGKPAFVFDNAIYEWLSSVGSIGVKQAALEKSRKYPGNKWTCLVVV